MDTPEATRCLEDLVDDFVDLLNRTSAQAQLLTMVAGDARGRAPEEALGKIARSVRLFYSHFNAVVGFATQGKKELLQPNQQTVKRQDAA